MMVTGWMGTELRSEYYYLFNSKNAPKFQNVLYEIRNFWLTLQSSVNQFQLMHLLSYSKVLL